MSYVLDMSQPYHTISLRNLTHTKQVILIRFWNLWWCHIDLDMRECYTLYIYIYSIVVRDCYSSYLSVSCFWGRMHSACQECILPQNQESKNQDSTILLDSILVFSSWCTHARDRWEHQYLWEIIHTKNTWFQLGFGICGGAIYIWTWGNAIHYTYLVSLLGVATLAT